MKKTLILVFCFGSIVSCQHIKEHFGGSSKKETTTNALYDSIATLDKQMFEAFNSHDIQTFQNYFTPDIEFYHDKGGLTLYAQTMENFKKVFANNPDIKRTLVEGSLEVYPIKDFGAIEKGSHQFCHTENGKQDCGTFKFLHIWKKENGQWKISRIVSYGH